MVAYSFKPRFILPIELGEKRQTIRAIGKKRHARPGETVQIYTGPRMRPRKVGEAVCASADAITIDFGGPARGPWIVLGGEVIEGEAVLDEFAQRDGFPDWQALHDFWAEEHDNPTRWSGIIITWGDTFKGGLALNPPAGD